MRRWLSVASASARMVSERPALWLPGALAWVASVGWMPLLVAVARPPSQAELTFLGARIVTVGRVAVERGGDRGARRDRRARRVRGGGVRQRGADRPGRRSAAHRGRTRWRLLRIALAAAVPGAIVLVFLLAVGASVAPGAFNTPDTEGGGPVLSLVASLAPHLHRSCRRGRAGCRSRRRWRAATGGSADAPGAGLARIGAAGWAQVALGDGDPRRASCFSSGCLLGVLWAPIGAQLAVGGDFDLATALLLVGFVAIWLCLVLAGGALHAWASASWSRLLAAGPRVDAAHRGTEPAWKPWTSGRSSS